MKVCKMTKNNTKIKNENKINSKRKNNIENITRSKSICLTILLCVIMLFSLSACSNDKNKESKEITVVLDWAPNTNHTGLYVALEKGYFEEYGLKVNIIQPPDDGATSLVASGGAEFGIDFQDSLAPAFDKENALPVTAVAAIIQHNTSGIVSLKADGIDSPSKLENKAYATWGLPVEQAMIKGVVEEDGGDFNKVNLIPTYVEDIRAALSADIDAVWIFYAWDGIACELAELETNYFNFSDICEEFDYYTPVIIGNNDYLDNNPDETRDFLKAVEKGYEFAIDKPEEAADILLKYAPELDKDLVYASQNWLSDNYKADAINWGYMDPQRWNRFYNWLSENELVENPIPEGTGFTNEFLD